MGRRNRQPFRPYRRTERSAKTDRSRGERFPKPTPFEPPEYYVGDIVYCSDKTDRAITKVEARGRVWVYHWVDVNGRAEGVSMECVMTRLDAFNDESTKKR